MRAYLLDTRAWPLLVALVLAVALIWALQPILTPFLVAVLLAYLGDPLTDRLETLGLGRTGAVVVVFTLFLLIAMTCVLLFIPVLGQQLDALQNHLPRALAWIQQRLIPWLELNLEIEIPALDIAVLRETIANHWQSTSNMVALVLERIYRSGLAMVGLSLNVLLVPVVTFYLLRDWDHLMARIRDLLPRGIEPTVSQLTQECDEMIAAFLRGQLLVMLMLGVVYAVGLWLIGLDLALLVGALAGLASIVPYLGFIIGILSAVLAVLFQFSDPWIPLALVGLVFLVGQVLESLWLTPILVGDRIGLHPVAVIFAVLAGGQLFGFTGVLLALPVAAVIAVLLRHADHHYRDSTLYSGPEASDMPDQ